MKARIKEVRTTLGLSQEEFAARLDLSRNFISLVEQGERQISDRTFNAICDKFGVNEDWLRNGTGEMLERKGRNDVISDFLGDLLHDQPDFRHRLISALATMTVDEWALLERKIREISGDEEKPDP